jgi:acyl-CoA thioesterase FadM
VDNVETGLRQVAGQTVLVCVEMSSLRSMPWPEVWRQRVLELEAGNIQVGQGI